MLFRFTDEQKDYLKQLENKIGRLEVLRFFYSNAIEEAESGGPKKRHLYAIPDDSGKMVPTDLHTIDDGGNVIPENVDRLKKELDDIPRQRTQLNKQFTDTLNQYAADHVSALKTPADIVTDAKQTASDAINTAFFYYCEIHQKVKEDGDGLQSDSQESQDNKPKVWHVPNCDYEMAPYQWDYADKISEDARSNPTTPEAFRMIEYLKKPPVIFESFNLYQWITGKVINKHLERLEDDRKELGSLQKDIKKAVSDLPFTESNQASNSEITSIRYGIITAPSYENALEFSDDPNDRAHLVLQAISKLSEVTIDSETGHLTVGNQELTLSYISENSKKMQVYDPKDHNLDLLNILLGTYKNELEDCLKEYSALPKPGTEVAISRKYLYKKLYERGNNRAVLEGLVADLQDLSGITAMIKELNSRSRPSFYPVINFEYYDGITDTFHFRFYFFDALIKAMQRDAIQTNEDGTKKLKSNGKPYEKQTVTYMVHPNIEIEKNKAAVENVKIIVRIIVKTADPKNGQKYASPHISAKELIRRNKLLKNQLDGQKETKYKNRTLKNCFLKTWDLLREKTDLLEKWPDIEIPTRSKIIKGYTVPTMKDIDNGLTYTFRHGQATKDWKPKK